MKKLFSLLIMLVFFGAHAQETANRFFYELSYKPGKDLDTIKKAMTILDITDKKSFYRDYLMVSQDSILKLEVENMMKAVEMKKILQILQHYGH